MIEKDNKALSIRKQCELLGVNRSTLFYSSKPKAQNLELEQEIYDLWLKYPFYGYRKIYKTFREKFSCLTQYQVRKIMNKLNLHTIYPKKKNLSVPCKNHQKYPYLLKNVEILAPNIAWASDITYIKLNGAFVYLVAIIDLYSRKVLSWRLSNTMHCSFCIDALREALAKYGFPHIFNTDQGSQFTSDEFIKELKENHIMISMDSKGRALDNIYVERLWRSLKYENILIKEYKNMIELREGVEEYFRFFNTYRLHQSLSYKTPDEVYNQGCGKLKIAI